MLYYFLFPLKEYIPIFGVFQYITFRSLNATVTSLLISFIFGPIIISALQKFQFHENVRNDGPQSHQKKAGTPTMGGLIIILSITVSTLLWARLDNPYIIAMLVGTLMMGFIGFCDDYIKSKKKDKAGLIPRYKIVGQILTAVVILAIMYASETIDDSLITYTTLPFIEGYALNLGLLFLPFLIFVIVGTSNSVNLTDGLDGLAIGLISIAFAGMAILSYISGNVIAAAHLNMIYLVDSGELTIFALSVVGSGLGFLWFNSYPAKIFMGDTGSLALGGALGIMAILLKKEFWLIILGGVFVMESLSVILQVGSYKFRNKKRIFKMAPIHHHFELKGWHESKVVTRFWIVGILLLLLTLSFIRVV